MNKSKAHIKRPAHKNKRQIKKAQLVKIDKELDKALENTFPASDATAKYM